MDKKELRATHSSLVPIVCALEEYIVHAPDCSPIIEVIGVALRAELDKLEKIAYSPKEGK